MSLHSTSSFKVKRNFFFLFHTKASHLRRIFCVKYCYTFGFKQLNKRNSSITGFQVSALGWEGYSSLHEAQLVHLRRNTQESFIWSLPTTISCNSAQAPPSAPLLILGQSQKLASYLSPTCTELKPESSTNWRVSKQSPIPMTLRHANRNRKTGTQLPSVNFSSQKNNPLLKFGARTAEETEWYLARSLNLHGKAHQHAEVPISQCSEPKGICSNANFKQSGGRYAPTCCTSSRTGWGAKALPAAMCQVLPMTLWECKLLGEL